MLRGRCSCAISERPTPSPAPKKPLSPIIPVHPGNSPVSPIIPVHTQKQGGGALLLNFQLLTLNRFSPLSPIIPVHPRNSPVSPIIPVHTQKQGGGAPNKLSAASDQRSAGKKRGDPVYHSIPGDFNRLGNSAPISRLSAVNCKRAFRASHSPTIGNRCPTSCARFNSYHYIKYPCRRADNF